MLGPKGHTYIWGHPYTCVLGKGLYLYFTSSPDVNLSNAPVGIVESDEIKSSPFLEISVKVLTCALYKPKCRSETDR